MDGSGIKVEQDLEFLQDNDSLYILPLKYVPLETAALRRGRLVKTFSLDTAVEIIQYADHGARGYFLIDDMLNGGVDEIFGWGNDGHHPDARMLQVLASLTSYDVYNLRIQFRENNIDYEGYEYLCLSEEMEAELSVYMRQFTRPLIETVFGEEQGLDESGGSVIDHLRNPDSTKSIENLRRLSRKLQVEMEDIPAFLDQFSNVYLAISYYKHYADKISILAGAVMSELDSVHNDLAWKHDPQIKIDCSKARSILKELLLCLYEKLDVFEKETKRFWVELTPTRFEELRNMVSGSQQLIAGVLCGIGTKLTRWRVHFPTSDHGTAQRRYDILKTEILPGTDHLIYLATGSEQKITEI